MILAAGRSGTAATGTVTGPVSSTDDEVATFDGTSGTAVQGAGFTAVAGVVAGVTRLSVDNLRLDGNTASSLDANGNILLAPNGAGVVISSGQIQGPAGTSSVPTFAPSTDPNTGWFTGGNGIVAWTFDGTSTWEWRYNRLGLGRDDAVFLLGGSTDAGLGRAAAAVWKLMAGLSGLGAMRQGIEVLARTADLTLTAAESGVTYTNTGASGQVIFTLPAATLTNNVGACFTFCRRAAQNLRIVAAGTDVINLAAGATAAGGRIDSNTDRSVVHLFVSATGFWDAVENGTWTPT